MTTPILLGPGQGQPYWVWGDRYTFKARGAETGGAYALMEVDCHPGSGTPPHIHRAEDELFYVLEGTLTLWCGGESLAGEPGSFVAVPKGTVHRFENQTDKPARFLVKLVPAGFEEFLIAIGQPVSPQVPSAPPLTDQAVQRAMALASKYHLEFVS